MQVLPFGIDPHPQSAEDGDHLHGQGWERVQEQELAGVEMKGPEMKIHCS